jgi:hypothetical protein
MFDTKVFFKQSNVKVKRRRKSMNSISKTYPAVFFMKPFYPYIGEIAERVDVIWRQANNDSQRVLV